MEGVGIPDALESRRLVLAPGDWLTVGIGSGLLGGLALVVPIVLWDWGRSGHRAFELPAAATSWLFGLEHFSHTQYSAWPLVVGVALLAGYAALSGIVFTGLADRVFAITRPLPSLGAGFTWGFVSFVFFWYVLLPIGREGAPFHSAAGVVGVAPDWVWTLGFMLLGLATGAGYAALRTSPSRTEVTQEPKRRAGSILEHAA